MPRNRILIGGNAYGVGNIGDDAVLQGILTLLGEAMPGSCITVEAWNGLRQAFLPDDVATINAAKSEQVTAALHEHDCFISGGGTMIGDELGVGFPLIPNARRMAEAKYLGKGAVMLGIGANPPTTPEGDELARLLVELADVITVRDVQSLDVCLSLGADREAVTVTADPAFLLRPEETPRTKSVKSWIRSKGKTVGVNVVNEAWRDKKRYKQAIARTCDILAEQDGYTPVFFCNEIRPGRYYDQEANAETAALMARPSEVVSAAYYTPAEMIDIISAFDVIISMRMHALIFAAVAETPFVAVSRVDKVDNFMSLFGAQVSGSVKESHAERLVADTRAAVCGCPRMRAIVSQKTVQLRDQCLENVEVLRSALRCRATFRHRVTHTSVAYAASVRSDSSLMRNLRCLKGGYLTAPDVARKVLKRVTRIAGARSL